MREPLEQTLARHSKIALQFSGGRDSLACLLLLREHLQKITVYWMNAGDGFPETAARIREVVKDVPNFVEIKSSVHDVVEVFGIPSDIVPWSSTEHAHALNGGRTARMQDRTACCYRSIMKPMHDRMQADGITLIIRGQKNADEYKGALRSGEVCDGIEFLYPIEKWSKEAVRLWNISHGFADQDFYAEGMDCTPACMSCSAWWDDGRGEYLKKHHPEKHTIYVSRLKTIYMASEPMARNLIKEIGQ